MKLLLPWISALSILTSFVIIEGTWVVRCFAEWPRATIRLIERPHVVNPIVATPTTISTPIPTPRKSGASFPEMIVNAANLCGVAPGLWFRVVARESGMRQWDKAGRTLRSTSGALGLAQVKPRTARGISKTLNPHLPWDNLLLGACYYRQMLDRFGGDQHRALVAYHNGPNGGMAAKGVQYADSIMEAQ